MLWHLSFIFWSERWCVCFVCLHIFSNVSCLLEDFNIVDDDYGDLFITQTPSTSREVSLEEVGEADVLKQD